MSNRTLTWSAALRELKADRRARPAVREEPLRTAGNIRGAPPIPLSAWRGRSGRRYVVVVHDIDAPDLIAEQAGVVLAVARDFEGRARLVAVRACVSGDPGFLGWLAACARLGAGEVHVHRLGLTRAEQAMIAADLTSPIAAHTAEAPR